MASKKIDAPPSGTLASSANGADSDSLLLQQLEDELKKATFDDDRLEDRSISSSSSASSASATGNVIKMQANLLSAAEQESAACMTFNESDIQEAIRILHHAETLCNAQIHAAPKKSVPLMTSVSKMVSSGWSYFGYKDASKSKPNSPAGTPPPPLPKYMTNGEIRARVVRAESQLLTSLILLLQESMMSYLKAGLNIRKGYKSYENVWAELQSMGDEVNTLVDNNTRGGIQFGLGTINIVLASLPTKILRIISSFGYIGDKALGFDLVSKCIAGKGIRSPLGSLMFLSYYTILAGFAPSVLGETNIPVADKILKDALQDYKESAFFLYFKGRNCRLKSMIKESTAAFELASSKATVEWGSELQRLCDYELGLNCAILLQWSESIKYFDRLAQENYWSKAFFLYFKAAALEECGQKQEALSTYQLIPGLVNRKFGGRTILVEQYVSRKVRLFEQNGFENTNLPALEILLIWNAYSSMTQESLRTCLAQVDNQISKNRGVTGLDSLAVLKTIKGAILHQLHQHKEGAECLTWVQDLPAGKIAEEKWVVPFACWEAGVGSWMEDHALAGDQRWARAKAFWDKAMGYSGYEFEFRLSIRIHAAMTRIQDLAEQMKLKAFH
ncbi:tetratricopeptide repeat domain 39A [Mortierella polycephala]|uniref:Tetratricopeptide repeat domain 39A n=1 Tax=Mortierella polycephala TaxID=41804 RepID=A0A9P6PQ22_9FUNG|nr:tetratricopeptide repeat domain 39A [Mortierella polycephala]